MFFMHIFFLTLTLHIYVFIIFGRYLATLAVDQDRHLLRRPTDLQVPRLRARGEAGEDLEAGQGGINPVEGVGEETGVEVNPVQQGMTLSDSGGTRG